MFRSITHSEESPITIDLEAVRDDLQEAVHALAPLSQELEQAETVVSTLRAGGDVKTVVSFCNDDNSLAALVGVPATESLLTLSAEELADRIEDSSAKAVDSSAPSGGDASTRRKIIRWVSALASLTIILIGGYFLMRKLSKSQKTVPPAPLPPTPKAPSTPAVSPTAKEEVKAKVQAPSVEQMHAVDKALTEYNMLVGEALIRSKRMVADVKSAGSMKGARSGEADNHIGALEAMTDDARALLKHARELASAKSELDAEVVAGADYKKEELHHRKFIEESTRRLKPSIVKLVKFTKEACGMVGMHYLKSPAVKALISKQTDLVKFADETKSEL